MSASPEVLSSSTDRVSQPSLDDSELDRVERRLERLATALDSAFVVPGLGFRFGADSLLGLVPGVGDAFALGLSGWLILEARRIGAPRTMLARMAGNVAVDALFGTVPVVGDVFDVFFKANRRNVTLVRGHIAELRAARAKVIQNPKTGTL
ncbi:MAG: DUF4112 domain-containing protein [Rhizobiales bacterium]|nr:DUF4112 domain-containing protein [Hyphomicrobiales bacterium]